MTLHHGDSLDVLPTLASASVDAVVTDPPYGLEFMGRAWDRFTPLDYEAWCAKWAAECLRVLKPGGHLLAFGGTRTAHRLAAGIEDAGFELRDSIAWLYGSGFPKSLDVSKAIDKQAGVEREVVGMKPAIWKGPAHDVLGAESRAVNGEGYVQGVVTAPATDDAKRWQGWGTALKPAFEPIVVARKPLGGTVAGNVLAHGTGALNIDACRIGDEERTFGPSAAPGGNAVRLAGGDGRDAENARRYAEQSKQRPPVTVSGRWPTNVVLDDTQAEELDKQSGAVRSSGIYERGVRGIDPSARPGGGATIAIDGHTSARYEDHGGASRFFPTFHYEPKAPTAERPRDGQTAHPTVKPLDLMRWLIRLVTPPGGTVLDPFLGSGTTAEACIIEGFQWIGIEREADYLPLIEARLAKPLQAVLDFGAAS